MSSISASPPAAATTAAGPSPRRVLGALALGWAVCFALIPLEVDRAFGLPAHPLFIHVPVILDPVLALVTLALLVRRPWRERYAAAWGTFAVVALAGTVLAAGAGEKFYENRPGISATLRAHKEAGENLRLAMFVFVALVLLVLLADLLRAEGRLSGSLGAVLPVLLVLTGAGAIVSGFFTVRAGHLGAKSVWAHEGGGGGGRGGFPGGGFPGSGGAAPGANGP